MLNPKNLPERNLDLPEEVRERMQQRTLDREPLTIGYVAKHGSGGNDDEGAIAHALEALGHRVERLREHKVRLANRLECDFVLVHHCHDIESLRSVKVPKVFWCFDLIDAKDSAVRVRSAQRIAWMRDLTSVCDLGFLTDGDHVDQDKTGKLHWLPQGADERLMGLSIPHTPGPELLFLGMSRNGTVRASFVEEMRAQYGERFRHIQRGVYQEDFLEAVRGVAINVAPDGPVSDRYFSNRLVNCLGAGGFMLHPYSKAAYEMFQGGCVFYGARWELHYLIDKYMKEPTARARIAAEGLDIVRDKHLYRHRVAELVRVVKERLF